MKFLQRLTYTAKYRNLTSKSGETDIRLIFENQTLRFRRFFPDSRVDASQFRKAEHGTECFLLDSKELKRASADIRRNALTISVEWFSWPLGPVKATLWGKRGKFLGSTTDIPEFLVNKINESDLDFTLPGKKTFIVLTASSKLPKFSNESK